MAKRPTPARRPIVALDDLAPQRELRAGAGQRVFGAEPPAPADSPRRPSVSPPADKRRSPKSRA